MINIRHWLYLARFEHDLIEFREEQITHLTRLLIAPFRSYDEGLVSKKRIFSKIEHLAIDNFEFFPLKLPSIKDDIGNLQPLKYLKALYNRKLLFDKYGLTVKDGVNGPNDREIKYYIQQLEIYLITNMNNDLRPDFRVHVYLERYYELSCKTGRLEFYANLILAALSNTTLSKGQVLMRKMLNVYESNYPSTKRMNKMKHVEVYRRFVIVLLWGFMNRVPNSGLIVSYLRRLLSTPVTRRIIYRQHLDLIKYLFDAANSQMFDIATYERNFVDFNNEVYSTPFFAAFSELFSMVNAYVKGDKLWAEHLLKYGYDVFINCYIVPENKMAHFLEMKQLYFSHLISKGMFVTLVALLFYKPEKHETQKKIFDLIWNALPEPFVNSQTIIRTKTMLESISRPFTINLDALVLTYNLHFGDYVKKRYEPRDLLHLTKCNIRSALKANFALPFGIERLGLPKILAKYVNLNL